MSYSNFQDPDQAIFTVLPSEGTSYSFKALVSKWLFATGGELVFPGRVKYRYKQNIHYAPFEVRLTLRPPLISNGIGALTDAILGSSARC